MTRGRASRLRPGECRERERGSATVEFAVALPAVVLVLGLILGSATWGLGAIRVQNAANEGARVAIVDSPAEAKAAALRAAGSGASARVVRDGAWIVVTVDAPAPWGPTHRAEAVARAQD